METFNAHKVAVGLALCLSMLLGFGGHADAQTVGNKLDGLSRVSILLHDQVTDGCLPNPNRLIDVVELELGRSGVEISTEMAPAFIEIIPSGSEGKSVDGRPTGDCSGKISIQLQSCSTVKLSWQERDRFQCVVVWSSSVVAAGNKPIQSLIENQTRSIMAKFALDLERDRAGITLQ